MKIVFPKDEMTFLKQFQGFLAGPRNCWQLGSKLRRNSGYYGHPGAELMVLERGAMAGDPWCMTDLARAYLNCGDKLLAKGLYWLKKAVVQKEVGAISDVKGQTLLKRIKKTGGGTAGFTDISMSLALLAEWCLTGLGQYHWETLAQSERQNRLQTLLDESCDILGITPPKIYLKENLSYSGGTADGLASYSDNRLGIRTAILGDFHRLLQVFFHELGHFVQYHIVYRKNEILRLKMDVSKAQSERWFQTESSSGQQDADTFAYNIYTNWLVTFGMV